MWWVLVILFSFTFLHQQGSSSNLSNEKEHTCPPSSCGKISNIKYPFRLKHQPDNCGNKSYELSCENDVTTLYLYSRKYYVKSINYNNFTIRLVDPGVQQSNCSSLPLYFLSRSNFCDTYFNGFDDLNCNDPYHAMIHRGYFRSIFSDSGERLWEHIIYLNCTHPVTNNPKYVNTTPCINWPSSKDYYIYAMAIHLTVEDFEDGCHVILVTPTSWSGLQTNQVLSYEVIHKALVYGFEVSWLRLECKDTCGYSSVCFFNTSTEIIQCGDFYCLTMMGLRKISSSSDTWARITLYAKGTITTFVADTITIIWKGLVEIIKGQNSIYDGANGELCSDYKVGLTIGHYVLPSFLTARFLFGITFFISLLIYKWRKRHWSMYECIELYLQQNNLMPIGYSYKQIKKMVRGFEEKLGEGGFGTVFKGNLRSGPCVAIKMLVKSKGNGQDFINEVASIGRIHHLNVIQLLGFCIEGSKRALVYEFMPNGSLDKFIFSKEGSKKLSCSQIHDISIGVARGIAYLHHGCEMKILHFDIKPHNILLDENFIPKISDFGLAKLYPLENSIVTMTAARGTIGYMAPELFYKNIGGVSYKADVYSFGMLLMEMASKRKNLNAKAEHSSQLYFPFWIHDQFGQEGEIEIEDVTEEENKILKKMIVVALWCIQLKPDDRPSMNKVVEMLEGDVESLEMPPRPTLYPHETVVDDQRTNLDQTMSSDDYTSSYDSVEREPNSLIENIA